MTREEAKEILTHNWTRVDNPNYSESELDEAFFMAIEALQDRPQGEWKHTITWQPYCSNCEYVFGEDEEYSPFWKFCPMCGAEMADNSLVNDITESLNDVIESQNDVIEVVRCKDCRHYAKGHCYMYGGQMNDDDYCSRGERQCNYFGEREEDVNGFKSVGQAWNTSQERREP